MKYEPFQKDGDKYKIAIIDKSNGELIDLFDINFPFCEKCKAGRIFDIALLLHENVSHDGFGTWSFDQKHLSICSNCEEIAEGRRICSTNVVDFGTFYGQVNEENDSRLACEDKLLDIQMEVARYSSEVTRYLKKEFDRNLVGIGSNRYTITNPKTADGYWESYIEWSSPLISDLIPHEFGFTLDD